MKYIPTTEERIDTQIYRKTEMRGDAILQRGIIRKISGRDVEDS